MSDDTLFEPFPKRKTLDSTKLKEYAGNNLEFGENLDKFSNRVKNTVVKSEICLL